jgi:branched-subunit amino acid aminotransferase/4-amino-4-deoxychorismate lyase
MHEIAPVPADAPVVERGVGFFETVLCHGRRAVLWEGHLARLFGSVAEFDFPAPDRATVERQAAERLDAHPAGPGEERSLRVSWIAIAQDLESPASWRLDVVLRAIPEATLRRRSGASAITLPAAFRRDSATVKSTSYFAAVVGLRHARRAGGDEGLFREPDGSYLEGTSTALVAWNDGNPVFSSGPVLPSVTRNAFLGSRLDRRALTRSLVKGGALLLGSLTVATPVVRLDGEECRVPDGLARAAAEFNARLATDPTLGTNL